MWQLGGKRRLREARENSLKMTLTFLPSSFCQHSLHQIVDVFAACLFDLKSVNAELKFQEIYYKVCLFASISIFIFGQGFQGYKG